MVRVKKSNMIDSSMEEPPLIINICPFCRAVDIDWDKHQTPLLESSETDYEDNSCFQYQCPYCCEHVLNINFVHIWSDSFAETIEKHLPENWKVNATGDDWHQVEVSNDLLGLSGKITIKVDDKGQIIYSDIPIQIT